MIITAIICATFVALGLLAYFFDWRKLPRVREQDLQANITASLAALITDVSAVERTVKELRADNDERDRHMTQLTHLVNDKTREFDTQITAAAEERTRLVQTGQASQRRMG